MLRARCNHFAVAHSDAWGQDGKDDNVIRIPADGAGSFTHDTMLRLLTYLYTDQVDVEPTCAMELIRAADYYQLPRLRSLAEDLVVQHISGPPG